ncbi:MAG TPA: glycosyltransferase family 4 protein [Saprospiraceae bacterium]|nr:glycosyltransferase family 4 protein [Saprospiraceae bacterium]HMP23677.1 glycosyltransferase family 4 protein [Saprospiraceae bacterium]
MRIALLTDGLFPYKIGGMQKHSLLLAKYLARQGVAVDLYFACEQPIAELQPAPNELLTADEKAYLQLKPILRPKVRYFPGHYVWQSYLISKHIWAHLQQSAPVDFIYAQGFTGWYFVRKSANPNIPIGVHPHGLEMYQPTISLKAKAQQWVLRMAMNYNLRQADVVFALGEGLYPILNNMGIPKPKILLSPNGIAADWLVEQPHKSTLARRFLFIGRYELRKGIAELNTVLQKLLADELNFTFDFVGPIPVEKQVAHPNITYWGTIKAEARVKEILSNCDVLVLPSHSEGMPTVILEAMASGLAILATDVGTVRSMVCDDNGWLIPAKSEEALENAMREIIHCDEEAMMAKQQASLRKLKANFLWEKVAETTRSEIVRFLKNETPKFTATL